MTEPDLLQSYIDARERVIDAVGRYNEAMASEEHSSWDAEREYAEEQIAVASLGLVEATNVLDLHDQPVGWPGREHIY